MAYLNSAAGEKKGESFTLSMSYTTLAEYLSVDRSAMMRELKKMRDEALVDIHGRKVLLHQGI